jgi:Glycosyl hydrolase family 79, N-terminal domain
MNRRAFIRLSAAASAAALRLPPIWAEDDAVPVRLTLRPDRLGNRIGADFTGLSYESAQLGNPNFFSGDNTALIGFVRRLGASGVLRIGGNTSEYCFWTPDPAKQPDKINLEAAVGPDKGQKAPPSAYITPQAIHNLRDFLDATGWDLIYGLNMGTGSAQDAAAEAAYVMDVAGAKLVAFQLCNEPDLFFKNGIRKADYAFPQFADEWQHYFEAIRARMPKAPFAGPDTAYNNSWLVPFANKFKEQARFLSQHYYAEGPPSDPSMTIERLLRPNPKLQEEFDGMRKTMHETGLPFRLAETNSCYSGGKPGVSDTFASALWGGDLMYQLASQGGMGINFHGGGYGWYTPIAGTRDDGFLARPIYYGMLLFAEAGSGDLVEANVDGADQSPLLTAYALRSGRGPLKAIIFNKNLDRRVRLTLNAGQACQRARLLRLRAPRVEDTTDVTIGGAPVGAAGAWSAVREETVPMQSGIALLDVPAASALLASFEG